MPLMTPMIVNIETGNLETVRDELLELLKYSGQQKMSTQTTDVLLDLIAKVAARIKAGRR